MSNRNRRTDDGKGKEKSKATENLDQLAKVHTDLQAPNKSEQPKTLENADHQHGQEADNGQPHMDIGEYNENQSTNGRRDENAADQNTNGHNPQQNGLRGMVGEGLQSAGKHPNKEQESRSDPKRPKQTTSHQSQSVSRDFDNQHSQPGQPGHYGHPADTGRQQQTMKQMQRAAEASKQMMYGVYGNVVSILEEYEARTQKPKAARSKIALPDQSRKTVEDIQSIVQTQLLLFETQQRACPKEVSQSINKELRMKTLHWAAVREEHKMPRSDTDKYICQLYEVLAKGKTTHEILDKPRKPVSAETIRENVQHIFKGKHDAMEIDQQFKHDDKKKATSPETRRSELDDAYRIGAQRMTQEMPELIEVLTEDIAEFSADIDDTK